MMHKLTIVLILIGTLLSSTVSCTPPPDLTPTKEIISTPIRETVQVLVTPTLSPLPIRKAGLVIIGSSAMTGKHYNPIWMTSTPQFLTFPLILPALTWFDDKAQPVLDLATKVDVNADATQYTFTLPRNAAWSDGTPLTTRDVAFTYKLALSPAINQSAWANNFLSIKGVLEYQQGTTKEIEGIKVVDDQTVRFELKEPNATFLFNTYLGILPSHILSKVDPKDIEKNPYVDAPTVTSGPYAFVKYEPGQSIQLRKKSNYWGRSVNVEEIQVNLFEASATMFTQLEAGILQVASLPSEEVARFRRLAQIDVLGTKGITYQMVHLDMRTKDQIAALTKPREQGGKGYITISKTPKLLLQDKRFRQALAYAVDKKAVVQAVAGGEGTPIYSAIFGPDWAINPSLNKYDLNLDRAKALMRESGVAFESQGTALWEGKPIVLVYLSPTSDDGRRLGEVLQQQLSKVGVRVDIKMVPGTAFLQAAIDGEGDLIRNAGSRLGADPSVSSVFFTCRAGWAELVMGYCNSKFDDLMSRGIAASKSDDRRKIYWDASAILNDELPSLFFFAPNSFVGVNKGLRGVKPSADPNYLTWNVQEWTFQQ